jgi:hypothetical protein
MFRIVILDDSLAGSYLGFSLEPMLDIVSGNVSTRGKQIVSPSKKN